MKRMRFSIQIFILLTGISGLLSAQSGSVWEGTASMSRYGEFPTTGLYAASNSFPRNTLVEVENLRNGRKATVIVADRLNNPALFLLLSREAAGDLGITEDETVQVRVKLASESEHLTDRIVEEQPYTSDPDINPAAGTENYTYKTPEKPEILEFPEDPVVAEVIDVTEEDPAEAVLILEDESPMITFSAGAPEAELPRLPDLALPAEPVMKEIVTAEGTEEVPERETPRLSLMYESPAYTPDRLPDLAVPEQPELPADTEEALPEKEVPRLTELGITPAMPELSLEIIPPPDEPEEETTPEPVPEDTEAPRLAMMPTESPEVGDLYIGDIDIPVIPDSAVFMEEDETPVVTVASASPFVEDLRISAIPEPVLPPEPEEVVEIVEVIEEPEDTTPELVELRETPEPVRLTINDIAVPVEHPEEEREAPDVAGIEDFSPLPGAMLTMAELDEPEPAEEPAPEPVDAPDVADIADLTPEPGILLTMTELDEPVPLEEPVEEPIEEPVDTEPVEETPVIAEVAEDDVKIEIPEDAVLVMEPAEPRPPEDLTPEALEVPGAGPDEPEDITEVETEPHHPVPPTEEPEEPLVALGTEESTETDIKVMEEADITLAVSDLEKGSYYVQLGVYSEALNAKQVADKFGTIYPVAVLKELSASKQVYKVLLGPVNSDESGGLLFNFRAKGFKDAFIRRVQ